MNRTAIETANRDYYDVLYRKWNPLSLLVHPLISFDQQSKSKRNYQLLEPMLKYRRPGGLPPASVLDYGFGHGSFLLKLPRSWHAYGCDLSPEAVSSMGHFCRLMRRRVELFTVDAFPEAVRCFGRCDRSYVVDHITSVM